MDSAPPTRRRLGRPPKRPEELQTERVECRMTKDEKLVWDALLAVEGEDGAKLLRELIKTRAEQRGIGLIRASCEKSEYRGGTVDGQVAA